MTSFTVGWTGQDDSGGSGIASYNIYVSDDGGAFRLWLTNTVTTSATFTGQDGHTYGFYSVATDNAGNEEARAYGRRGHHDGTGSGCTDDHLVQPGRHHLRHGLGQHATRRHGQRAGDLHLYAGRGTVLGAGNNQTLSVTFTPTDTTDYTTATQTVSINVDQATPTITWSNPADITYGTALGTTQLDATASVPGTFVYTPASGHGLWRRQRPDASRSPSRRPTRPTTRTATDDRVDQRRYRPRRRSPGPTRRTSPTARPWAARSSTPRPACRGRFVYTPASGTVLGAGSNQTLSVTFTPTDTTDYTTATKTVSINVDKATPTITWSNPADITYGTALGSTQLDATASVPGTFVYTPASGTVLHAGNVRAFGHLHADRHDRLHDGDQDRVDQRRAGHADDHLVQSGGHHLRHGLGRPRNSTPRPACRGPSSTRPPAGRCSHAGNDRASRSPSRRPTRPTTRRRPRPCRSTSSRPRRRSPGPTRRTSPMARPWAPRNSTPRPACRGPSSTRPPRDGAARRQRPEPLGHLHADRHDRLHHGDQAPCRSTSSRPRRRSPGPTRRTSPTARPWGPRNSTPRPACRGPSSTRPPAGRCCTPGTTRVSRSPSRRPTRPTTRRRPRPCRSTSSRPRRRSPGPTRRTSPTARPWAPRSSTPRPACRGPSSTRPPRDGAARRQRSEPLGHLHADRHDRLHDGDEHRVDQRRPGAPNDGRPVRSVQFDVHAAE